MAASQARRGTAGAGRPAGKTLPQPNDSTMTYMAQTLSMLEIPDAVDLDLPPMDLSGWTDPSDDLQQSNFNDSAFVVANGHTQTSSEDEPIAKVAAAGQFTSHSPKRKHDSDEDGEFSEDDTLQASPEASTSAPPKKPKSSPPETSKQRRKGGHHVNGAQSASSTSRQARDRSPSPDEALEHLQLPPHPETHHFSKPKLKALVTESRQRGRSLKHAGDARMRAPDHSLSDVMLAMLEQTDAVLLYIYSFWVEDLLAGRQDQDGRLTKPACMVDNWRTLFGLLNFVRGRAEQSRVHLIVCLLDLLEAMVITHMQRHERRNLHSMVDRQMNQARQSQQQAQPQQGLSTTNGHGEGTGTTPQSSIATPPSESASVSALEVTKLQDAFLKLSSGVERSIKLFRSAQDLLHLGHLQTRLPDFANKIAAGSSSRQSTPRRGFGLASEDQMTEPCKPWTFAYGLDTNVGYAAMGQAVSFGRALLEDIAKKEGIEWVAEWRKVEVHE